jgi:hypothetical protein
MVLKVEHKFKELATVSIYAKFSGLLRFSLDALKKYPEFVIGSGIDLFQLKLRPLAIVAPYFNLTSNLYNGYFLTLIVFRAVGYVTLKSRDWRLQGFRI